MISSKLKDKVDEFKKEFALAKALFDRSVLLEILRTTHKLDSAELDILKKTLYKLGMINAIFDIYPLTSWQTNN